MAEEKIKKLVIALYKIFINDNDYLKTNEGLKQVAELCAALMELEQIEDEIKDVFSTDRMIFIDSIAASAGASIAEGRAVTDLVVSILNTHQAFKTKND